MTGSLNPSPENTSYVRDFTLPPLNSCELHSSGLLRKEYDNFLPTFREKPIGPLLRVQKSNSKFRNDISGQHIGHILKVQESIFRFSNVFQYKIIPLKMYFLRLKKLSSFSNNFCFSSGQKSCVGNFATEHNLKIEIQFSAKKEIKTVEHDYIYKSLLHATCFDFRENSSSNK